MSRLPALGPRGEGWVAVQVVLFALVIAGLLVTRVEPGSPMDLLAVPGGVLAVAGLVLGARGILDLRTALTPFPRPRDSAELVQSGAYRLVRHPIYGGLVVGIAGCALLLRAPLGLLGALVLLAFFRLKSAREEAWLRARYPDYAAYAARTRRLIPWVY